MKRMMIDFHGCTLLMSYCQTPSGVVVVVVPGPKEAQGHTRNLLINSHNDNMLFTADGDKAEIGPDKLRVTGTPMAATCCVSLDVAHTCWWKGFGEKNEKIITLTTDVDSTGPIWFDGKYQLNNPAPKGRDSPVIFTVIRVIECVVIFEVHRENRKMRCQSTILYS